MKNKTPIFSIYIPVYRTEKNLDKVLDHIDDQDYKFVEKIVVVNKKNTAVIKKAKSRGCVVVTVDKDIGAPYARNRGASVATGDYLLSMDCDIYLNPGALSYWAEGFKQHPEADFVYSDYEIISSRGSKPMIIQGWEFNKYLLTCNNYINGCTPIRKKAFVEWDNNLKSLQDWDLFLTMVERGSVGVYLGDFIAYKTDMPERTKEYTNISMDSHENWIERRDEVKKKHNIPDRKLAVMSIGAPHHGLATAEILGADFLRHWMHKPNKYEGIYMLGMYPDIIEQTFQFLIINFKEDIKRLVHWIGTDVYQLHHHVSWNGLKEMKKLMKDKKLIQFSEFQPTHDELAEVGIETEIVPLPPKDIFTPTKLPKDFSVGIYINPTQDMYYEAHMYDLAKAMPDIKFKFFGNRDKANKKEENMEWVGYVDMDKFIDETSCNLRITKHDGLPLAPVQFFMKGRDVITNVDLKYAYHIDTSVYEHSKRDIIKAIREVKEKHKSGKPNLEASEYYRKLMDHETYKDKIYSYL